MKSKSKLLSMLLAGSLLLLGSAAFANKGDWQKHKQEMMDEFMQSVNATDEQKTQLKGIHDKYEPQMQQLHQALWKQKQDLMMYVFTPQATEAHAKELQEQMADSKERLNALTLQAAFEKKAVLTPEQQAKAREFMTKKSQEMQTKMNDTSEDKTQSDEEKMSD